jgi:hypothetical protein
LWADKIMGLSRLLTSPMLIRPAAMEPTIAPYSLLFLCDQHCCFVLATSAIEKERDHGAE